MSDGARASERGSARSHERERVEYNKRTEEESPCCGLRDWSGGQPAGRREPCALASPPPPPPSDCQHALILANALQKLRGTEGSEEGGDARPSHRPTER